MDGVIDVEAQLGYAIDDTRLAPRPRHGLLTAMTHKNEEARLDIYEPPRFFEAFLRERGYAEPPDITARICGICPVAYQDERVRAIEDACGVTVPAAVGDLGRLLYCGEWIESHTLHIYLLHAPCCTRRTSSASAAGSSWPPPGATWSSR